VETDNIGDKKFSLKAGCVEITNNAWAWQSTSVTTPAPYTTNSEVKLRTENFGADRQLAACIL